MTQSSSIKSAYPGVLAASHATVSKRMKRQSVPGFAKIPPGFEPPSLADMRKLLMPNGQDKGLVHHLSRVTASSILQALESPRKGQEDPSVVRAGGYVHQLTTPEERRTYQARGQLQKGVDLNEFAPDVNVCRYCMMFQELLHRSPVPIEVLNHSARIETDFNPQTNISEAGVTDFQMFVPARLASTALERSHPLLWETTAKEMFDFSRPAKKNPSRRPSVRWLPVDDADVDINEWSKDSFINSGVGYLYERAIHPYNEQISATVENVFRIKNFANGDVDPELLSGMLSGFTARPAESVKTVSDRVTALVEKIRQEPDRHVAVQFDRHRNAKPPSEERARILSYRYELETCVESDFGIGLQNGGLDIDDGRFVGSAVHFTQITGELIAHLKYSDLCHLALGLARRYEETEPLRNIVTLVQAQGGPARWESERPQQKAAVVKDLASFLQQLWPSNEAPWLLTISASKRLRYTYPRNGQIDLWSLLTWMAPAFLLTFINRSVCQLPHALELGLSK